MQKVAHTMQLELPIKTRRMLAEDVVEITLALDDKRFPFVAGQYCRLTLPKMLHADARGARRDFSIASSPNDQDALTFAFRTSNSGFKRTIMELPIGSPIGVEGPFGLGRLAIPDDASRPVVMIAGGIGITPFRSLIREAEEAGSKRRMTLIYVNKDESHAAYIDELREAARKNRSFKLIEHYGPIDEALIKKEGGKDITRGHWCVAGPPLMVGSVRKSLLSLGVDEREICVEEMAGYDALAGGLASLAVLPAKTGIPLTHRVALLQALDRSAIVAMTDARGDITYANSLFQEISGYTAAELIGQNHRILKSGHHAPSFYDALWATISSGRVWRGEIKNRTKSGSFYWVDSSIAPIFDAEGRISGYVAVRFPITDRKRFQEDADLVRENLDMILRNIDVVIYMISLPPGSAEQKIEFVSVAVASVLGYAPREFLADGALWYRIMHTKDVEAAADARARGVKSMKPFIMNYRLRHKTTGEYRLMEDSVVPRTTPDGTVKLFGIARDVTNREMTKLAELQSTRRLADLTRSLPVGIYRGTLSPEGHFIEANHAFVAMFEADSKEELLRHGADDLYQDRAGHGMFLEKLTKLGSVNDEVFALKTLKGKPLWCSITATVKKDVGGEAYFDGIIYDVSERVRAERALDDERKELKRTIKLLVSREHRMIELKEALKKAKEEKGADQKSE